MAVETEVIAAPKRRRGFFLIAPLALILGFGNALTDTVVTDLIVYRTCLVSLNINATECFMLRTNASSPEAMDLETKVEPYASVIVMTNSLVKALLPAILSMFIGTWSDRAGRRPLLILTLSGSMLMHITLALMCNWDISPWYLLLASIPEYMVGGLFTAKLALICLISDTTTDKNKMVRMTQLEISFCVGIILAGSAGSLIHKNYGHTYVFATVVICYVFALVHTYFWIPETVKNTSKESIRGVFKISSVKELVASCFVKREGFNRLVVWLSISTLALNVMIRKGEYATVNFLFARARLGWDVQHYFNFYTTEAVLHMTGLCGISLRSRFPGVSDTSFALMSFVSAVSGALTKSLTWKSWHMYLSAAVGIFSRITTPVMRSVISKCVPAQDVGKVFSLVTMLEILGAFGGPALYTLIYSHYLPPIYPSPVYLLSVSVSIASLICVVSIELSIRNNRKPTSYYMPAAQEEDLQ